MKKIKKYYPKIVDHECVEICHVTAAPLRIGAIACTCLCKYCKFSGMDKIGPWIKCSKIKKGAENV